MHLPAPDESLWVGVLRLALGIPGARSLKDRRRAVAQVRDRIRARAEFTVAEVGHLESHTMAIVAVGMVSNDPRLLRSTLDALGHQVESWDRVLVTGRSIAVMRPFENDYEDEDWDQEDWESPDDGDFQ